MNFGKKMNEEAVSPVIGVILMVAITVILAATIAMFAFGSTENIQENKVVALQASVQGEKVVLNLNGGASLAELKSLKFTWDGTGSDVAIPATGEGDFTVNGKNQALTGGVYTPATDTNFAVGDIFTVEKGTGKFQVIGIFADGTEQVLFNKMYT